MNPEALAKTIGCTEQYVKDLLQGTKIPSDETIRAIVKGLDLDNLKTDQIRTFAAEDRRRHDARYRRGE